MSEHRIVFTPSGLTGSVASGTTVLEAARALGVDLDTVCGGRGLCGRCQVAPATGTFSTWGVAVTAEALSAPTAVETDYRGRRPLAADHRLGCAAAVLGDVVVDVPAESQVHRQVVRKDLDLPPVTVDPSFTTWYVEVPRPELGDDRSHADLVRDAVATQHRRSAPRVPLRALPMLRPAIDQGRGAVTVVVDDDDAVVAVWPGFVDDAFGIAIDVGSTTIAGHLCDLSTGQVLASAGRMNPQIRFGEDLMSRVSYAMLNPGGDRELTESVRTALDGLIGELVDQVHSFREYVLEVVLVGNPVMHHVVLGLDPTGLGEAPFTLTTNRALRTRATDLDLTLPYARCYVAPCIAGHVGADTAAAILAEAPHRAATTQLLVDIGTNAEIVLGSADAGIFAASSPTGPAFEGAQLSSGQRATAGAIEAVRIDPVTLEPRFEVIGVDVWSDDPAFDVAVRTTGITGICGSGVIDAIAELFLAGVVDRDGVIDGAAATRTDRVEADGRTFRYVVWRHPTDATRSVTITQNDVRAIQLAKAALRAGIDLLVERAGGPEIDEVRLAGAFGAHVDPLRAMVLGLVPDRPVDRVRSVGNAAGVGAIQALLSRTLRTEMEQVTASVTKIETATEPRFQELFVAAMAVPHAHAETPHLAAAVELPATRGVPIGGRRRRRRPDDPARQEESDDERRPTPAR